MPTVREVTYDLFREHGMTTMFGNPGSTELPMLTEFPDDFDYVLGLQEAAVVGMADGHAQVTGKPTLVNLHTAPGLGNAMGGTPPACPIPSSSSPTSRPAPKTCRSPSPTRSTSPRCRRAAR